MESSTAINHKIELPNMDSQSSASNKDVVAMELGNSTSIAGSSSPNSVNIHGSSSDLSYHGNDANDDINEDDAECDESYMSDYDDEYMYDDDDDDQDYLNMQAQFDNEDLPAGVEVSVSWMKPATPNTNVASNNAVGSASEPVTHVAVAPAPAAALPISNSTALASSSSTVTQGPSSDGKAAEQKEHDIMENYRDFLRFDTVDDSSDHHYVNLGFQGQQPPKTWTKKIQDEWKILEKDLPDTIFVRVYESRMDLLRAVIIGPAGTPYHDGLFFFDILFPPEYPRVPPMVYYYSGGLRLNPNLYDCGKVCLSLLNTWSGKGNEKWLPESSTMLQVLVSIQALILNAKPFFNEPGHESTYAGEQGERRSKEYNENTFILSLKTMMYTLRRPPKHYEDFVAGHFRTRARHILLACKAYMNGVQVGSFDNDRAQGGNNGEPSSSQGLRDTIRKMLNGLVSNFTRNGSTDCEEFRIASRQN